MVELKRIYWSRMALRGALLAVSSRTRASYSFHQIPLSAREAPCGEGPDGTVDRRGLADLMTRRFTSLNEWVIDDRHLKVDGVTRGYKEPCWAWIRKQTETLLGAGSLWPKDAVMTEVVHCRSCAISPVRNGRSQPPSRSNAEHPGREPWRQKATSVLSVASAGRPVALPAKFQSFGLVPPRLPTPSF